MATDDNKAILRSFYEEVFNNKNLAGVDAFIDPQIVEHDLPPGCQPVLREPGITSACT